MATKDTYETLGFYEEVMDVATGRLLGTREVQREPSRALGYAGQREELVTVPLELKRGHKGIVVQASPGRPLRVRTTLQKLCGRMLWEGKK